MRRFVGALLAAMLAAGWLVVPGVADAATSSCPQAPSPGAPIPPLAPRDPLIAELGLDQAWSLSTGAGVTVGVVDTGVDPASPKLAGAVLEGDTYRVSTTPAQFSRAADGRVDCDGHGTEVAGVIAGRTHQGDDRVSGVAPAVRIYPVAIQGEIGQAPPALIAAAIRDAAEHSDVVNLSFAQQVDSPEIRQAVDYALRRGVVVVAAAANEAGTSISGGTPKWYPAAYPGVLAVTSVSADGTPSSDAARGSWISLAAPGEQVTTVPRGGKGYVSVTGTSFATAIVSGTVALLLSRFPDLTPAQVAAQLERTAVPPGDGGHDDTIGYGIVDPYAALTATVPSAPATTPSQHASVPLPALRHPAGPPDDHPVLAVTALLIALAVLVGLATVSVRSGRRRGWHAGAAAPAKSDERTPQPHPAELG